MAGWLVVGAGKPQRDAGCASAIFALDSAQIPLALHCADSVAYLPRTAIMQAASPNRITRLSAPANRGPDSISREQQQQQLQLIRFGAPIVD